MIQMNKINSLYHAFRAVDRRAGHATVAWAFVTMLVGQLMQKWSLNNKYGHSFSTLAQQNNETPRR